MAGRSTQLGNGEYSVAMACQSRSGTGVKPVWARLASDAADVDGVVTAGMITSAARMLVASPVAITTVRWRSSSGDNRTGRSRSSKLSDASAVATRALMMMVVRVPRWKDRVMTRITGQCHRYVPYEILPR